MEDCGIESSIVRSRRLAAANRSGNPKSIIPARLKRESRQLRNPDRYEDFGANGSGKILDPSKNRFNRWAFLHTLKPGAEPRQSRTGQGAIGFHAQETGKDVDVRQA